MRIQTIMFKTIEMQKLVLNMWLQTYTPLQMARNMAFINLVARLMKLTHQFILSPIQGVYHVDGLGRYVCGVLWQQRLLCNWYLNERLSN